MLLVDTIATVFGYFLSYTCSPNQTYDHLVLKNPHQINFYQVREIESLYAHIANLPGWCKAKITVRVHSDITVSIRLTAISQYCGINRMHNSNTVLGVECTVTATYAFCI